MRLAPLTSLSLTALVLAAVVNAEPPPSASGAPPATPEPPSPPVPSTPSAPKLVTWVIDPKLSSIVIEVFKDGPAQALAHDHVVAARDFAGTIVADPADPSSARVEVTVQTASLDNDAPELRTRFRLPLQMSEKDRKTVGESMRGPDQLDVARYPTVTFRSTAVTRDASGALTLKGDFTLHGVTRSIAVPFDAKVDQGMIDGKARFGIKTSDYGITPYSALMGAVKNKDEVILNLHLVGRMR